MINFIHIENFKSLLDTSFPLGHLNLVSGLNGMGKSTLMQSLLLLRQSYERDTLKNRGLLLNGDYISIGTGKDALSSSSDREEISFTVKWSDLPQPEKFEFKYQSNADLLPLIGEGIGEDLENLSLFNSKFQYLRADRLGPQSHYQLSEFHIKSLKSLGHHGEFTVHFIAENGAKDIKIEALKHPKAVSRALLANIEAWISVIAPGIKIKAVAQPQFSLANLSYSFHQGADITEEFKPKNVGFGLSYVLPVITSILSAEEGDLLIIEAPESHLHPAGQSLMGQLCAIAASNRVQLIIESHSDHFLNGIRVAVKQRILDASEAKIFFLQRDLNRSVHASEVMHLNIDDQGRIDHWPDAFFDQWDKDLDQLL